MPYKAVQKSKLKLVNQCGRVRRWPRTATAEKKEEEECFSIFLSQMNTCIHENLRPRPLYFFGSWLLTNKGEMNKLFILLFLHHAVAVKHSLSFSGSLTSGLPNLPEFSAAMDIDDIFAGSYDSNNKKLEAEPDWAKRLLKLLQQSHPDHLEWYLNKCTHSHRRLKATIDTLMLQDNQSAGVHILQCISSCKWDDVTGHVTGLYRYGYDGEDFLEYNMEMLTWIPHSPKALSIKQRWDVDKPRLLRLKDYYHHQCPDMLKLYINYTRGFLQRTDLPSMFLLQRTPSSPVSCFATGFFPDTALIFWSKDGEELYEDVEMGELLPNHDGTFQISVDLDVSSVREDEWGRYNCVFHFSELTDDIITKLDRKAIKTNWVPPSEFPAAAVIGGVVGGLALLGAAAGILIWTWKKTGFHLVPQAAVELHPPSHTNKSLSPP